MESPQKKKKQQKRGDSKRGNNSPNASFGTKRFQNDMVGQKKSFSGEKTGRKLKAK